jgi:predicted RNase H-like nuclease (RuvC/YqgF family)
MWIRLTLYCPAVEPDADDTLLDASIIERMIEIQNDDVELLALNMRSGQMIIVLDPGRTVAARVIQAQGEMVQERDE